MGLKNIFKLKGIRIKRFLTENRRRKGRKLENGKKACSWMKHVNHGYYVVELEKTWEWGNEIVKEFDDSVVVQREQIEDCELWFFGVFDDGINENGSIAKYMQSNFFDKMPQQSRVVKQSKQAMKKALLNARPKTSEGACETGSSMAMVIDGDKLVIVNMGNYRSILCRDGEAYQICRNKQQQSKTQHWSLKLIPGILRKSKVHKIDVKLKTASGTKISGRSKVVVGSQVVDSKTEFIILASPGVWEVMKHQEAVNLIRHIEDPQKAAECLATEALIRMSKSNISCLIIRFD